ncbi:MAG TPA: hypothetical protein VKB41_17405 [Steroidobacteraceae bacterium]|nr:hypothetical protein [Steroidobacteraceae bacterium]
MAVKNADVRDWINAALTGVAQNAPAASYCDKLNLAFRSLQEERRKPGQSLDESLAAAEHYMYARQAVCSGYVSRTQMDVMVVGYQSVKWVAQRTDATEKLMRTRSDSPTSLASSASIMWGLYGSKTGEDDRLAHNKDTEPPLFNVEALKFGAAGYSGK